MIGTIYTRHTFELDDPRFRKRLELAAETSIPAVREALSSLEAEEWTWLWVWWCRPGAEELILEHVGHDLPVECLRGDTWHPDDEIQLTLDSDDMIPPGFIDHVEGLWEPTDFPYLRTWQPTKLDLRTSKRYKMAFRYSSSTPSMFYAVYNPTERVRVYARTHTRMSELAPCELVQGGPGVTAGIHDDNQLMTIAHGDKEIG